MQAKICTLIVVSVLLTGCASERVVTSEAPAPAVAAFEMSAKQSVASQIVPAAASERRLVKTVELDVRVPDTVAASENLSKLAAEFGGHVTSMNADRREGIVSLTLRVPEGRIEEALARIKKIADRVDRESVKAEDVTDQFVDLSARLKTLEATEGELRALLSESRQRQQRAEDIMAIYRELTQIRSNIEQIRGQLNLIENLTSLATITVNLSPTGSPTQVVSLWQPSETIRRSFRFLAAVMTGLVDFGIAFVIVVIPPVLILGVIVWLVAKAAKAWLLARSRRKMRATPNQE